VSSENYFKVPKNQNITQSDFNGKTLPEFKASFELRQSNDTISKFMNSTWQSQYLTTRLDKEKFQIKKISNHNILENNDLIEMSVIFNIKQQGA